jgi:hypothetical protein
MIRRRALFSCPAVVTGPEPNLDNAATDDRRPGDLGQLRAVDLCGRAAVQIERLANPVCVKGQVGGALKHARGRWS